MAAISSNSPPCGAYLTDSERDQSWETSSAFKYAAAAFSREVNILSHAHTVQTSIGN